MTVAIRLTPEQEHALMEEERSDSLGSMLARPTVAIRAVDFVRLIGTGMCLGGAIVAAVWQVTQRRGGVATN